MTTRQEISFVLLFALNVFIGTQIAAASVTLSGADQAVWVIGLAGLIGLDLLLVSRIMNEDETDGGG